METKSIENIKDVETSFHWNEPTIPETILEKNMDLKPVKLMSF